MLESISWDEFLTTTALLIGGYYVIITLLLYRSEITNIFKQRGTNLLTANSAEDLNDPDDLMGTVRYENRAQQNAPRENLTTADDLEVAHQNPEEPIPTIDLVDGNLKNDFVAIQSEINSLIGIVSLGSKEESTPLFNTLLSNYPQFIGTRFQAQVTHFIHDSLKKTGQHNFDLTEINSWWPSIENQNNNH
jgi:hypothetical protein